MCVQHQLKWTQQSHLHPRREDRNPFLQNYPLFCWYHHNQVGQLHYIPSTSKSGQWREHSCDTNQRNQICKQQPLPSKGMKGGWKWADARQRENLKHVMQCIKPCSYTESFLKESRQGRKEERKGMTKNEPKAMENRKTRYEVKSTRKDHTEAV